ncbi:TIGR04282 family arsenosugar biosynthesis glycosyltransferase [Nocardia sp. CA-290969]|uniref:TIGR04282 family arsenosugar biosynthesis glycosyltransferase n=1 Tax=Nocardia sp. CA-290969 TaxID=3239986 RepID=UPI003D8BD704
MPIPVTVLIVAKAPVPGFAKTRMSPPLTPVQAARLAAAALLDTLDAVRACPAATRMVAFTGDLAGAEYGGEIGGALADFEVVRQRGSGFGVRLANAHSDAARAGLPVLQIGMDTPQAGPRLLTDAARSLAAGAEALLGPAADGGWWALGLSDPRAARLLTDVPMSTGRTGAVTRKALQDHGYRVETLPTLADVDYYADALRVAADCTGRFAAEVRVLDAERVTR